MIRVRVKILGALDKPRGKDDFVVELADASRVEDLLLEIGYRPRHLRFIVAAVNGAQRKLGHVLGDSDEVILLMPTSGG